MVETATHRYLVRPYTYEDEEAVLELMRLSLGESPTLRRTSRLWQWKHFENPFGPSLVKVAVDNEDRVIGLRSFLRWEFRYQGYPLAAVRPVDTATHPSFRRGGVFTRLTGEAVQEAMHEGTALIFNTPNHQSLPGYLKLGWRLVGPAEPLVKVLNYPRFAAGLARYGLKRQRFGGYSTEAYFRDGTPPATAAELVRHPGLPRLLEGDDRQWEGLLHTPRSRAYFTWRYVSHPSIRYYAVQVEGPEGTLDGCAVFRTSQRFGMKEVMVTEVLVKQLDGALVREVVRKLSEVIDADYVIAYAPKGSFRARALERHGFRRVPRQGLNLAANRLSDSIQRLPGLHEWGLTLGDLEFF